MQTNDSKTDNLPAGLETMDVWAFHDALGEPYGELPARVEMPEGLEEALRKMLEEAFSKMLEEAKAADEASAVVSAFSRHPSTRHVGRTGQEDGWTQTQAARVKVVDVDMSCGMGGSCLPYTILDCALSLFWSVLFAYRLVRNAALEGNGVASARASARPSHVRFHFHFYFH
jgi:hypothetical protein